MHFVHFMHFIHHSHKGKRKARRPQRKREKHAAPKGKRENTGRQPDRIPLGNQTARTHTRTARHKTISWLDSSPNLRYGCSRWQSNLHGKLEAVKNNARKWKTVYVPRAVFIQ